MADEKKAKQINKNAILVHQLLPEDKNDALSYFSKASIKKASYGSEGLQIFFKEYDIVHKSILRQKIEVKGLFYKIYPMVTNLTVCGIGPYVSNAEINCIMQSYGFIIDSYRTREITEDDGCTTVSLANDYRIVLGIPEVFANFSLTPVRLPCMIDKEFEISFFCRLCRCNGHMQFQCPNARKTCAPSLKYQQNMDVFRRLSSENISENSLQSNFCVDQRNSKTDFDSPVKNEKKQSDFSYQNCYSKNKSYKNDTSKNCFVKSTFSMSKNCHSEQKIADNMNVRKEHRQSNFRDNKSSASKEQPSEILERRSSFEKIKFHQHYGNEVTRNDVQASTSDECSNEQISVSNNKRKKKQKFQHILSCLLPPNTNLDRTMKLIKTAYKCHPKDIPAEVEDILQNILNHNRGLKQKDVSRETKVFLNWIAMILNKKKLEEFQSKKSYKKPTKNLKKEQEHVKDEKSTLEIPKQATSRKRKAVLSLGIKQAVSATAGILHPELLKNFLNQVRGRKKQFEVASAFTKNIPALASQLLEVQNTYYKYVRKRGPEEDRDINYIKRLRERLLKSNRNTTDVRQRLHQSNRNTTNVYLQRDTDMIQASLKSETDIPEASVKTESDIMAGMFVKREVDMTELTVKEEKEVFMRQAKDEEDFLYKNLSSNTQCATNDSMNRIRMPFSFSFIKTEVNEID